MELDHELLLQTFSVEASEQLAIMEQGLVELEHRPGDNDLIASVFRAAHTLKGNAAIVGFTAIKDRAHEIEDVLEALRNGSSAVSASLVSRVLTALDALRSELSAALPAELEHAGTTYGETSAGTLRIDAKKLDRMLGLSGEISIARGRLRAQLADVGPAGAAALESHLEAERLYRELQDEIMRARLVPLGPIFRQYQRVVRDLALAHDKQVELAIEGDDVEIDTALGEHIRAPLLHMLRNALDHGIELPEQRAAAGKSPVGRLTLTAQREASQIVIALRDDGAGFNKRRIAARAGLSAESARAMRDDDLFRLVLAPGFSTAEAASELSGRGVGMDVVSRNIEALRGSIAIASEEGAGSTITLRLPLTLAIIDGFFVEVGRETFVLPLDTVTECRPLDAEQVRHADGSGVFSFRGEPLPYLRLRDVFGMDEPPPAREHLAIVRAGQRKAGIAVDGLLGQDQAVIKPLGALFREVPAVAGSTIGGNGRVALILDVPALLALAEARHARLYKESA